MPHIITNRDGTTFDLKKVAAIVNKLSQDFLREPESYKPFVGAAVFADPSDPQKRYMLPLESASWVLTKTHIGISVPLALVLSGACVSSENAMPTLLDLPSGKAELVKGVAQLHGVEPATYTVVAGNLRRAREHLAVFRRTVRHA